VLPKLEGIIARRILLNFRADPSVVQQLLPAPLKVQAHGGYAIVGVCLIRLEQLRPKGLPSAIGVASENMAHRVAILYPSKGVLRPGVFIWRRETDQRLVTLLGGRLFPGVHQQARFEVKETLEAITMNVQSSDGASDVEFSAQLTPGWKCSSAFATFQEVSDFLRQGECGFSCSLQGDQLEGMKLRTLQWKMEPLVVTLHRAAFFQDESRFPSGSVEFDCGLIMRGLPHEWHEIKDIPEMAAVSG
jgi:Uncharacterized conserved protein (COG2071)